MPPSERTLEGKDTGSWAPGRGRGGCFFDLFFTVLPVFRVGSGRRSWRSRPRGRECPKLLVRSRNYFEADARGTGFLQFNVAPARRGRGSTSAPLSSVRPAGTMAKPRALALALVLVGCVVGRARDLEPNPVDLMDYLGGGGGANQPILP